MKINKEDLKRALEIVKPGLSSKELIPQSTSFAFINGRVVTYNDEISLSHPVEGLVLKGAVEAGELYKILGKLKKDEVVITEKEEQIILQSGRTKVGLSLISKIELPLDQVGSVGKWQKLPEDFTKFMSLAMASCSRDMSRPLLTAVHVNGLIIEASDTFRITKCTLEKKVPTNPFLIPANSVQEVIKLKPIKIAEGNGWIHFQTKEETILSCRIFQDEFPDTKPFIKVEGTWIDLPRTTEEVLERASVFAEREHVLDETILISLGEKRMKITSQSKTGWFEEEVNIKYKDTPVEFAVTPYLLQDILSETLSCVLDENRLKFEGDGWIYVTMLKETKK